MSIPFFDITIYDRSFHLIIAEIQILNVHNNTEQLQ